MGAFAHDADAGARCGDDPLWIMPSIETTFGTREPGSWTICREMVNEGDPLSRLDTAFEDARLVFRHLCGEWDWNNFCGGAGASRCWYILERWRPRLADSPHNESDDEVEFESDEVEFAMHFS